MNSKCIKVKINEAENVINYLKENNILNKNLKIKKDQNYIYIPVLKEVEGYENIEMYFEEIRKINSYKDLLNLPEEVKNLLPTSYDRIGSIIIIKLPDFLIPYKEEIAKALVKFHKNVTSVAIDKGVKGELRIRDLEIIYGKSLDTEYKENGIRIYINPAEVYFSPRLGSERLRISKMVKDGEIIIDMFCGAGPFSLLIAKRKNVKIYAIDKNKKAIEYLKKSIEINGITNIVPIEGDINVVIEQLPYADRIIMDHPTYSMNFIDTALKRAKAGTIIHIYVISENINKIKENLANRFNILEYGIVHGYSPRENMYYFDLEVK